jgi:glutamyl-tRNA synthetase
LTLQLQNVNWTKADLEVILNAACAANEIGFGKLAAPLRAALAGRSAAPSVFDMMLVLGRDETIARLADISA